MRLQWTPRLILLIPRERLRIGFMDQQAHWDKIYRDRAPDHVNWYRPHLEASLALIEQASAGPSTSIIDVGGGESALVDDLLARCYCNLTVLDISHAAIAATKKRLGDAAGPGSLADRRHYQS